MKATTEEKRTDSVEPRGKNSGMNLKTRRGKSRFRGSPPAGRGENVRKSRANQAGASESDGKSPIRKDRSTPPLTKRRQPRSEINNHAHEKRRYPDPIFSERDNSWGDRSDW